MSRTRTHLLLAVAATLIGVAAAPAASHAASLGPANIDGVDSIRYSASPGEVNRLTVAPGPAGTVSFADPGAIVNAPGPDCVEISAHEARCPAALVTALAISLGDGDDRLTVGIDARRGLISGDTGDDTLTGGDGDERLNGGTGNDVLDGRGGADLLSGQDGSDSVRYASRTATVTVNLATDTLGEEGESDEHDTVNSDVESVVGGAGNDSLTGNPQANLLDGGAGDDAIDAGAGNDTLAGGAGNDLIDGSFGNDSVDGGAGNDRLTGGTGSDDVRGGAGADSLHGRDGDVDRLDCGADADTVDADTGDTVAECEVGAPSVALPPTVPAAPLSAFNLIYGMFKVPTTPVTLRGGHVTLSVSCPAASPTGRCSGVISLEPVGRKGKGKAKARSSRRTRRFSVGEKSYAVRAGKKAKVRVRISTAGRRAINRTGSAQLKVLLRRTKRAKRSTRIGTLKVRASRRTKRARRPAKSAS